MVGEATDKTASDIQAGSLARNAKLREKHKWAIEKPKLDNARRFMRNLLH